MRRILVLVLVGALVGACSNSDGGAAPEIPETSPPATTVIAQETASAESLPAESVPSESLPTDIDRTDEDLPSGSAAVDEAIAEHGDDSIEALLARWAALTGPLPSLPDPIRADVTPSLTEILRDYPEMRDRLDPADAEVIDARIDELLDAEFHFDLDVSGLELDEAAVDAQTIPDGTEGFRGTGFAPRSPGDELDDDDFLDGTRDAWVDAARGIASRLGLLLPGVSDLRVTLVVTQPSFWVKTADPGESTDEPGGATLIAASGGSLVEELRTRYDSDRGSDCFLITARDGRGPTDARAAAGMLAHELFHCWHYNRVGKSVDVFYGTEDWIAEGLAGWVGESLAGGSYYTRKWLPEFVVNPFALFENDYEAYGFWGRINEATNLWDAIPGLIDTSVGSNAAVYDQALAAIPASSAFVAAGALQNGGLGQDWVTQGWMPVELKRSPAEGTAGVGDPAERTAEAGVQRADRIAVSASEGDVILIDADGYVAVADMSGGLEVAAFGDSKQLDICVISCVCPLTGEPRPADATIDVADPTLFAALAGRSAGPSTLAVEVVGVADSIEQDCAEPEPAPTVDGAGLLGTWRANPESVAAMFAQASAVGDDDLDIEMTAAGGAVTMTFLEGGRGEFVYDGLRLSIEGPAAQQIRLDGSGKFQWGRSAEGIEIAEITFSISSSSSAFGDNVLTLTDKDVPDSESATLGVIAKDDRLTITSVQGSAGQVFFPVMWTRQS